MTVICATSFSERSRQAVKAAAALAGRLGEPLALVHVAAREEELPRSIKAMQDEVRALRARLDGEVEGKVLLGEAVEEVARFAEGRQASVLLVGSSPPRTAQLGVADAILQAVTVPCLVVRQPHLFDAWAEGRRALKVILGVDSSTPFAAARELLVRLAERGPVVATAAHVYWPPAEYRRLGLPQPLMFTEPNPALEQALVAEVVRDVGPLPGGAAPQVRLRIGMGWTGDQLVAMAEEEGADLLLVGTHRRRGVGKLWSVSHHALRAAPMSVACVPAEANPRASEAEIPHMREVIAATDFTSSGDRTVPYAFSLVEPGGTVHLLHVTYPEPPPEERRRLEERLQALVPSKAAVRSRRVTVEVVSGEPGEAIAQAAERADADAICVGSNHRGVIAKAVVGSVGQALLGKTHRPVLVVPRKEE